MALPVNIDALIHGQTIEWERLEFKQGWNPEDVLHTMCAFANDLSNWGGGYIIIGIADRDGRPVLPPEGLDGQQLDSIQRKVLELGNRVSPGYFPVMQPYVLEGRHILVLWCPAGDNRPYTVPTTLGEKAQRQPFVRVGPSSVIAKGENLRRLNEITARIPFDDRTNNLARLNDLDLGLIRAYLHEIGSDLSSESIAMPFADLCRAMHIAKGPDEDIRPVNVGLMFFCKEPERFFPRAWIELVRHDDSSGRRFREHYFKGPLHMQLRDALSFLQTNVIAEQVMKRPGRAQADRFFNFPYDAVEEALCNAVYHKSYEIPSPIEVQVWPDRIEMLSHPGPMPPVNAAVLSTKRRIVAREYRNRRIGDMLKELHLTEGRGTGFPTIYDTMADNGSPAPVFETDEVSYVLVTLPAHPLTRPPASDVADDVAPASDDASILLINKTFEKILHYANDSSDVAGDVAGDVAARTLQAKVGEHAQQFIKLMSQRPMSTGELLSAVGLKKHTTNRQRHIDPLLRLGWLELTLPENPTHPGQRYRLTASGHRVVELLE